MIVKVLSNWHCWVHKFSNLYLVNSYLDCLTYQWHAYDQWLRMGHMQAYAWRVINNVLEDEKCPHKNVKGTNTNLWDTFKSTLVWHCVQFSSFFSIMADQFPRPGTRFTVDALFEAVCSLFFSISHCIPYVPVFWLASVLFQHRKMALNTFFAKCKAFVHIYIWLKYDLGQKYHATQVSSTIPRFELITSRSWCR